jgi:cell division initiation protein
MEEETSREKKMLVEVLGEPVALAPSDLYDTKFKRAPLGYNPRDVRSCLDTVADDIERLIEQNRRLRFQVEQLQDQLSEYRRTEESLKNALVSSEKLRSEILNEAKKEGELIIDEARLEAKRIYHEAEQARVEIRQEIARLALQKERFKAEFGALLGAHREMLKKDIGTRPEEG